MSALTNVRCKFCGGPIDMPQRGWEPGTPVYCSAHHILVDSDPFMVAQAALDDAEQLQEMPADDILAWPWAALNGLAGPLVPGRLYYLAAFPGGGKTTFLTHCVYSWLVQGKRITMLPLEADPHEVYTRLICLELGVSADEVLSLNLRRSADAGDEYAKERLARLAEAFRAMRFRHDITSRLNIIKAEMLTLDAFRRAAYEASERKSDVLLVDHVDHVEDDPDDRRNQQAIALSDQLQTEALRQAKALKLPIVLATQLNSSRTGNDPMAHYRPPAVDWLYNKGKKEQVAAGILGLYRPLRDDIPADVIGAIKQRSVSPADWTTPNAMGVNAMKLRYGGSQKERSVLLRYEHGRITDMDDTTRRDRQAHIHGLRLGSPSERR